MGNDNSELKEFNLFLRDYAYNTDMFTSLISACFAVTCNHLYFVGGLKL